MNYITVFGSSRCNPGDTEYLFAEKIGSLIGQYGYNVATGGYQGTMEAVSKGASAYDVKVIGVTVPSMFSDKNDKGFERKPNIFINQEIQTESLSNRIHFLIENSSAFVVLPGKIGTLTELFVAWNSVYLYNINENKNVVPIFLKKDFWESIIKGLPSDMELDEKFLNYFDSEEEFEKIISKLN